MMALARIRHPPVALTTASSGASHGMIDGASASSA